MDNVECTMYNVQCIMMVRKAPILMKFILEQPWRGKTHEVQITPHKRSAVWGLEPKTASDCGDHDTLKRSVVWGGNE